MSEFHPALNGTEQRLDAVLALLGDIRDRLPAPAPEREDGTRELREPAAPMAQKPAEAALREPTAPKRPARKPATRSRTTKKTEA